MFSTVVRTVALCSAAAILVAATRAEAPRPEAATRAGSPLRLIDPSAAPGAAPQSTPSRRAAGAADRQRLLQNTSDSPIAGWHFACVFGLADGRSGWIGQGSDAFPGLRTAETVRAGEASLLLPGEALVVSVPEPPLRESPYEVWSCGPTAAIFADGSAWGAPRVLDRLFARRLDETREAIRLLRALERVEEAAATRRLAVEEIAAALDAALPQEERWGRYRGEVAAATRPESPRAVAAALAELERNLRDDVDRMIAQLRLDDLRQLLPQGGR
ncbi:MAG TPA: hypothetical protein VF100_04820 [Thermoanaerobaculia bacterium]